MNKAHQFDMLSRTVGEPLPDCVFYDYEETLGYKIEFHGELEEVSRIPLRLDIAFNTTILIGDAKQVSIYKNGGDYVAEYRAYALHRFENEIPA